MLDIRWLTDIHNPDPSEMDPAGHPVRRDVHRTVDGFVRSALEGSARLVINTGDNIDSSADAAKDAALQADIAARLAPLANRMLTLPGNHDIRHGATIDLSGSFNFLAGHSVRKFPEATVIVWRGSVQPYPVPDDRTKRFYQATESEVAWLEAAVREARADKPVLVFSHVAPVSNAATEPVNENEAHNPERSQYANGLDILERLQGTGRGVWYFAGHRHVNRFSEEAGIRLFTMDRVWRPEAESSYRKRGANYGHITVDAGALRYRRYGASPVDMKFML